MNPYRIGVISDTHGQLRPEVFKVFEGVELILHCGDVERDDLLIELEAIAPVQAISGNVDWPRNDAVRPMERRVETPAGRIAMTHGHHGHAPSTDLPRMVKYFSDFAPAVILYGHSHVPKHDLIEGVQVFNPGAAGPPRFHHKPSVGLITLQEDGMLLLEHRRLV